MNKKLAIILTLVIFITGIVVIKNYSSKNIDREAIAEEQSKSLVYYPPGIGMYENYIDDTETHISRLGFSFRYPPHLYITEYPDTDIPQRLFIVPVAPESNAEEDAYGLVISVGLNDEEMTAEEWLLSENSGYFQSIDEYGDYYKFSLDGQEAVYTDSGMWVVVNTPDNEYRLSIALLPDKKSEDLLFTEMGVVIDSLRFK